MQKIENFQVVARGNRIQERLKIRHGWEGERENGGYVGGKEQTTSDSSRGQTAKPNAVRKHYRGKQPGETNVPKWSAVRPNRRNQKFKATSGRKKKELKCLKLRGSTKPSFQTF